MVWFVGCCCGLMVGVVVYWLLAVVCWCGLLVVGVVGFGVFGCVVG